MELISLLQLAAAFAGGSAVTWLLLRDHQLTQRLAELERARQQVQPPAPAWAENLRLDHRAQLLSVAALVQLSLRDQLDALMRLSPEMARQEIERVAPQLITRENIK